MSEINNRNRFKQIHNFTKIQRLRGIMPTDIDGFIDYGGNAFVYLEGKVEGQDLSMGQRIALERVVRSHWKANHPTIAIVYEHNIPYYEEVMVHECLVTKVYGRLNGGQFGWKEILTQNVTEIIERFENAYL